MPTNKTAIALIGCGFVADYYVGTLEAYPQITIAGVYDKNPQRLQTFTEYHKLNAYTSLDEALNDPQITLIVNLTDPRSHYDISRQALNAGKHVYSEKPLAMNYEEAKQLVDLAKDKQLLISGAPCSVLGKTAQTLAHAISQQVCGQPRLVYAELDDGMVHKMAYKKWLSISGAPWPYRDEFEVGCTLEHAGYYLTWLIYIFGAIETVTAYSDCLIPDKVPGEEPLNPAATADSSFGILKFTSGVVARLTTTIVGTHDHSLRVFCDNGVIEVKECWDNDCPVYYRKLIRIRRKSFLSPLKTKVSLPDPARVNKVNFGNTRMDFLLGVQSMIDQITTGKKTPISPEFYLHMTEVSLALQYAGNSSVYTTKTGIPRDGEYS